MSNSFVTIIFFQSTFFKQATGRWAIQRTKIFFVIEDTPAETTGKVNGRSGKLRKILAKKRLILRGTLFRHFSKHNICLKTKWDVFTKPTASCPISGYQLTIVIRCQTYSKAHLIWFIGCIRCTYILHSARRADRNPRGSGPRANACR